MNEHEALSVCSGWRARFSQVEKAIEDKKATEKRAECMALLDACFTVDDARRPHFEDAISQAKASVPRLSKVAAQLQRIKEGKGLA